MSESSVSSPASASQLARVVGVPGAVFMGLGSILGTGIFVSIGIAAGLVGPSVVIAVALAALVATCNGLSSAQLAASHPVSGGTYEYGYRYLNPTLGFSAGWLFLCAKSASAATAALGFAGYLLNSFDADSVGLRIGLALGAVAILTAVVAGGMKRSNRANTVIVLITLAALGAFVVAGIPSALANADFNLSGLFVPFETGEGLASMFHATALMFVAYTGYGRIATLGEEVHDPRKSIPKAIIITLLSSMVIYGVVTLVAVASSGAIGLAGATASAAAPLEVIARTFDTPEVAWFVALGAVTAMLGVLINLLLGLSRVVLAMARRGDMPRVFASVDSTKSTPRAAVILVGVIIAALVATGSVKTTWSFSAFTVLVYYALTNLAALRLPKEVRLYPRIIPVLGLVSCLGLAFWVEPKIWGAGIGLLAVGIVWHRVRRVDTHRDPA